MGWTLDDESFCGEISASLAVTFYAHERDGGATFLACLGQLPSTLRPTSTENDGHGAASASTFDNLKVGHDTHGEGSGHVLVH